MSLAFAPRLTQAVATTLAPLDRLRWLLLKASGPIGRALVRNRSLRVACAGTSVVLFALAATLGAPFWLLALGPVLLGTPHLVADLRYLVIRPGLHRRRLLWLPVGAPLVLAGIGWHSMTCGLIACGGMAALASGPAGRKAAALGAVAALLAATWHFGELSVLIFAHLHNFIAVLLWWLWRPSRHLGAAWVVLLFVACSGAILAGALEPGASAQRWQPAELGPDYHLSYLAPGLEAPWALRWVLLFAFAQSVHYGVWLRLIPEDDRPQPSPRTFAASFRALAGDFGLMAIMIASGVALAIAIWAVLDLAAAREGYLRLALFHGYLELAALIYFFVEKHDVRPVALPSRGVTA